MAAIPDSEKARRYRRKLVDLLATVEAWGRNATRETAEAMLEEARIVRSQLDVEERFQGLEAGAQGGLVRHREQTPGDPGGDPCAGGGVL